jgi:fido (protein-threonine AMPylation protein)
LCLLPCPEWTTEDQGKLPDIAQAASAIVDFILRQNPKRYILGHGDLKVWHRELFIKVAPVRYYAGNYRCIHAGRPCLNAQVGVGPNLGTPPAEVEEEMKKFSSAMEGHTRATDEFVDRTASPIARLQAAAQLAAFTGGSVIRIHPFLNGNGRIARLTMNFFLYRYLGKMYFSINRPPTYDYAQVSTVAMADGNFTPLYQYLLQIIALG